MWFGVSRWEICMIVMLSLSSVRSFSPCLEGTDGPRDIVGSVFFAPADSGALIGPIRLYKLDTKGE